MLKESFTVVTLTERKYANICSHVHCTKTMHVYAYRIGEEEKYQGGGVDLVDLFILRGKLSRVGVNV